MVKTGKRKRETLLERSPALKSPSPALAASLQRTMPEPTDVTPELIQRAVVGRHSIVSVMPFEHFAQPGMLHRDSLVPASSDFFFETSQFGSSLLP